MNRVSEKPASILFACKTASTNGHFNDRVMYVKITSNCPRYVARYQYKVYQQNYMLSKFELVVHHSSNKREAVFSLFVIHPINTQGLCKGYIRH